MLSATRLAYTQAVSFLSLGPDLGIQAFTKEFEKPTYYLASSRF